MACKPRMAGCPATCGHYRMVIDYRQERERQERGREDSTGNYRAELLAHASLITFKDWLIGTRTPDPELLPQIENMDAHDQGKLL